MFVDAYKIASAFTFPVIINQRSFKGKVATSVAAFIVLNSDGWVITAAHVVNTLAAFQRDQKAQDEYRRKIAEIEQDERSNPKAKRRQISRLHPDSSWVSNFSFWWGADGLQINDFKVWEDADIAVGRLEPFSSSSAAGYPVFSSPEEIESGMSVCRLGFPFSEIASSFDEATGQFVLEEGAIPVPRFPMDGIVTRMVNVIPKHPKAPPVKFVETSTPGMRGQSGGPLFDKRGRIVGIQSSTRHLALGFSPRMPHTGGREIVEHQFLNVGLATHVSTVRRFLDDLKIRYSTDGSRTDR